jgi:hypothetical protein
MLIFSTLLANLLVALSIILNKNLHNTTSFYIMSSTITGMIISMVNMPFETIYVMEKYSWSKGLFTCTLWYVFDLSNCSINLSSFTIVSYIRLKSIKTPNKPWASRSTKRCILILIWLVPILIWSNVNFFLFYQFPPDVDDCYSNYSNHVLISLICVLFLCPLCILLTINVLVMHELKLRVKKMGNIGLRQLRAKSSSRPIKINAISPNLSTNQSPSHPFRHQPRALNLTKEKKALLSLVCIQVSLVVCWMPYIVILPLVRINKFKFS